jgi:hypothetical protein
VTVQNLVREAQAAMLRAFDRADTVTAAQLNAAMAGFSEKTASRGRAELTREGVLVRSKRGMEGEVTYRIDRATSLAMKYRSLPFSKTDQRGHRMADNAAAAFSTEGYDADDGVDGAIDYEGTRSVAKAWGWLVPIIICICSLGAICFVRRRFGASPIGKPEPFPWRVRFSLPRVTLNADRELEAGGIRRLRRRYTALAAPLMGESPSRASSTWVGRFTARHSLAARISRATPSILSAVG